MALPRLCQPCGQVGGVADAGIGHLRAGTCAVSNHRPDTPRLVRLVGSDRLPVQYQLPLP